MTFKPRKPATKWYAKNSVPIDQMKSGDVHKTRGYIAHIKTRPACGKGYIVSVHHGGKGEVLEKGKWINFPTIAEARNAIKKRF